MALTPFVLLWAMFAHRLNSRWLRPLVFSRSAGADADLHGRCGAAATGAGPAGHRLAGTDLHGAHGDLGLSPSTPVAAPVGCGYGFEALLGSDNVRQAEIGDFETGIAQGMVHGHNSYVDAVVTLGLPGWRS